MIVQNANFNMKLKSKSLNICSYSVLVILFINQMQIISANLEELNESINRDGNYSNSELSSSTTISRRNKRAAVLDHRLWDYAVIPYGIDNIFTQSQINRILQAMREWEKYTCLRFVEWDPRDHPDYVVFTKESCGCCSDIGNQRRGMQTISIGHNCDKLGIIIHEIGHTIGYYHEQTRPDRDKYIYIIKENIKAGEEHNFRKKAAFEVNTNDQPYDYDSIMHYGKNEFSDDKSFPVIIPKNKKGHKFPDIGQRTKISEGDKLETNLLYKCAPCGQTLLANSAIIEVNSQNIPVQRNMTCEWRIIGDEGEKIILDISINIQESFGCISDYVLIVDGYWSKSPIIGRFCGKKMINRIISTENRVLIIYIKTSYEDVNYGFTVNYTVHSYTQ